MDELLEEHRVLLREIFPRFHGTEINNAFEAAQNAIEIFGPRTNVW